MIATLFTVIAAAPWMRAALRYGAIALAVFLFLLSLRRSGERAGRLAERLETTEKANDVQRRMLEAAAHGVLPKEFIDFHAGLASEPDLSTVDTDPWP